MNGVESIAAERKRQIEEEGWTPEHDAQHDRCELSAAAACYAHFGWVKPRTPTEWPWDACWWKPTTYRRDLVKAGALIAAEIDRVDRMEAPLPSEGGRRMSDMPERIWAENEPYDFPGYSPAWVWHSDLTDGENGVTRYLRSDVHDAEIERLTAENDRLSNALRDLLNCDVIQGNDSEPPDWRCDDSHRAANAARLALDEMTATAQDEGDYGTPEGGADACPQCGGHGYAPVDDDIEGDWEWKDCPACVATPDPVRSERGVIAQKAREYADHYPIGSDGRNTFILLAEWIEARGALEELGAAR
jgi:hypothetical protein